MKEGFYLKMNEKHLYLLDSKRKPIECLTNLISNFNLINVLNTTGEMSFKIYYEDDTKHIYNSLMDKISRIRLEDYGEFVVDTAPEVIEGEVRYKTVNCKNEEYMLNKRLLTLVNNSKSYFSGVLWTTDISVPCVMREFFNEVPSWSMGTVDVDIDNTPKAFRDIEKQNMLKFVYENIEEAFDCIPFFDSLNRTISFKKYENAIDDTGIVISLSNFIDSISKESINDTFCTRMYVEGSNLDIRRVNSDGRNYVYHYEKFYDFMSESLSSHLKAYIKTMADNDANYETVFAEWSEVKTQVDIANATMDNTDKEMARRNEMYLLMQSNGASEEELSNYVNEWSQWQIDSGRIDAINILAEKRPILEQKDSQLRAINNACKITNFLTAEDFIELDQFEIEGSYKQEAFAYIKGMTEAEKGNIAQILKTYATREISRCNSPRYTWNVNLSNFCTIEGCEYFAECLDVGKYITLYDDITRDVVKLIIVKIETDSENPKDLKLTFSDKMSGHEKFPELNDYLNNAIKNMEDIEKINFKLDEVDTKIEKIYSDYSVMETSLKDIYKVLPTASNSNSKTPTSINIGDSETSKTLTFAYADESTNKVYTLSKSNGKITSIVGDGISIPITRG